MSDLEVYSFYLTAIPTGLTIDEAVQKLLSKFVNLKKLYISSSIDDILSDRRGLDVIYGLYTETEDESISLWYNLARSNLILQLGTTAIRSVEDVTYGTDADNLLQENGYEVQLLN